ncbi:Myc-type, basic helix-loop-helix (bHLH) domain-containing protein [Artemisia annua]|uniref:Myc-type, basic helix-loop-helix (BHLH) domain-containing protein n=1 Tax=Artemisia annua TaxID=35608 RepID=A0A2U1NL81_ARTAN|nr:Myc-type, basic helix-loop-helix (bHLH) domain-containing protein [Artemisia annua]
MSNGASGGASLSSHENSSQIRVKESRFLDHMKHGQPSFTTQQHVMYQNHAQSKQGVPSSSSGFSPMSNNLIRQSSSPAGFFEYVNIDDGYSMMRAIDKYRHANGSVQDSQMAKSRMVFSSGSHSLSRIPENEGKGIANSNGGYVDSFGGGSWDASVMLNDGFMKEFGESDGISSFDNQNDEGQIRVSNGLSHQLSLPTSSTELSEMEKLLQLQDNVPLRSRAKRGCATHPRSIAERVNIFNHQMTRFAVLCLYQFFEASADEDYKNTIYFTYLGKTNTNK